MNKAFTLLMGITLMTSIASGAPDGTPDQDPIVNGLRQRFRDGGEWSMTNAYRAAELDALASAPKGSKVVSYQLCVANP